MNIPDIQNTLTQLVESLTTHQPTLSHATSSKGVTFTLKIKRTRPAHEAMQRGAPGNHAATMACNFDGSRSLTLSRKIVPEDTDVAELIEDTYLVESLDDMKNRILEWQNTISALENDSEKSRQAKRTAISSAPRTKTPRTKPRVKAPQNETSPSKPAASSHPEKNRNDQSSHGKSVRVSDVKDGRASIDHRFYKEIDGWYVPKVMGEFTNEELVALIPPNDPRHAWTVQARHLILPSLQPSQQTSRVKPCVIPSIGPRSELGGMLRTTACPRIA